ncbi:HpyAIV family type II restriction enzyme [[Mycoplasma] collis]|uniref:HpyAIV family type II restriction enzyme n=1 Tax=[Mycoplasma] collis TaxID=2127 RepID=UPI00051BE6BB|nr:hypothetical protein [[Mycoplasma] collis]
MFLTYEEFANRLIKKISLNKSFYINLLITMINNPERYCGLFRLSNIETKLIQNITQSNEIKFGNFIEEITTVYLSLMGYKIREKKLILNNKKNKLLSDQFFEKDNILYLLEQKIRDDHDSSKKRGQISNFFNKIKEIKEKYPEQELMAIMWFVDNSLIKNKNFYKNEIDKFHFEKTKIFLFYGEEFFNLLINGKKAWEEIISYLIKLKKFINKQKIEIPDYGASDEGFNALISLPDKYWNKLISNENKYVILKKEIFSTGNNFEKAKIYRDLLKGKNGFN